LRLTTNTQRNHVPTSTSPRIPKKILFNFKENIFNHPDKYPETFQNLQKALATDRSLEYEFYDDSMCAAAIARMHSKELANWFELEDSGAYKSDMCRLAMLYEHGGYYMDNDLEIVANFLELIPANVSITSAISAVSSSLIFQAFLGATPGHPVIKDAMDRTLQQYKNRRPAHYDFGDHPLNFIKEPPLGPQIMSHALKAWLHTKKLEGGYTKKIQSDADGSYLFLEIGMQKAKSKKINVHDRKCCTPSCDFLVVDMHMKMQVFWSRMDYYGKKCTQ